MYLTMFALSLAFVGALAGTSLAQALERAVTLEEAARTYSIAKTIGAPVALREQQARASFDYYHHRYGQTS